MGKIIKFEKSHKFLDDMGFPQVDEQSNIVIKKYKPIQKLDISKVINDIEFREDGIYIKIDGIYRKGYLYKKKYYVNHYYTKAKKENRVLTYKDGFPRIHILECKTILNKKEDGTFKSDYFFANTDKVDVFEKDRKVKKQVHKDKVLALCYNCKIILEQKNQELFKNTEEFQKLLEISDQNHLDNQGKDVEIDIYGYPLGPTDSWDEISYNYRQSKNYTCEDCGFGGNDLKSNYDKEFIQTHHINGFDKTNTHTSNLKCLCILCHANQDDHHRSKFENNKRLQNFIKIYKDILIERGNKYIQNYL